LRNETQHGRGLLRRLTVLVAVPVLILLPPLSGIWLAGRSLDPYLEFPPRTRSVVHAPFAWLPFLLLGAAIVASLAPFVTCLFRARCKRMLRPVAAFPWWGTLALGWTVVAWFLAWTRLEWMHPLQPLTFTPLWLGYIVLVNALTFRRLGRCLLLDRPRYVLALFPLSAVFWWSFEYLNRFTQNWHYVGGGNLSGWEYLWQATLPFSTVLPAVLGTTELVGTYPQLIGGLDRFAVLSFGHRGRTGWALVGAAAGGLVAIGIWPNVFFPLLWMAPLMLITGLELLQGLPTIFREAERGDWRRLWSVALAALICGFFWELWNVRSLAHWEYAIPSVHAFKLFEMPALGYAGYFPFGLECWAVAHLVLGPIGRGGEGYRGSTETDLAQRNPTVAER